MGGKTGNPTLKPQSPKCSTLEKKQNEFSENQPPSQHSSWNGWDNNLWDWVVMAPTLRTAGHSEPSSGWDSFHTFLLEEKSWNQDWNVNFSWLFPLQDNFLSFDSFSHFNFIMSSHPANCQTLSVHQPIYWNLTIFSFITGFIKRDLRTFYTVNKVQDGKHFWAGTLLYTENLSLILLSCLKRKGKSLKSLHQSQQPHSNKGKKWAVYIFFFVCFLP